MSAGVDVHQQEPKLSRRCDSCSDSKEGPRPLPKLQADSHPQRLTRERLEDSALCGVLPCP
eukprot:scaffold651388_cov46-Prasinocladus_malaysianus.AAC.1